MSKPWWQYLAISEPAEYVLPEQERLIAFVIMLITFIIITPLFVFNQYKLSKQGAYSGSKIIRNYTLVYLGMYLSFLNSFFLRISIFVTDGEYSVFGQEKGVLFLFGIMLFLGGATYVAFNIINFRTVTVRRIQVALTLFILICTIVVSMQFMIIFGNASIIEASLIFQSFAAFLGVLFFVSFIASFLFEMSNDPSKIEKLRLVLLSIGMLMMVIQLFSIGIASLAKRSENADMFVLASVYIIPIAYLISQPIAFLVFNWSIFTPNWLLIKAKVIQPSFREFLSKRN